MEKVHLCIPATTANLGPGFDTLGLALSLYNEIIFERQEGSGVTIEIEGEGKDTLPTDASNIVYQATQILLQHTGGSISGMRITLINRIPLARGLGSSAAALIGGLAGTNFLLGQPLSDEELVRIAVEQEGHPDNVLPAFYGGGIVSAMVDGKVHWTHFPIDQRFKFVLVIPAFQVETKQARAAIPLIVPHRDAVFNVQRVSLLLTALAQGKGNLLRTAMEDRLHQPYREKLMGPFQEVIKAALEAGAKGVALSGAGPTVLAVTCERTQEIAEAMQRPFAMQGIPCRSLTLTVSPHGLYVVNA